MLVKDYMTRHPLLVEPHMSIVDAQRYMGEHHVRHLPVVGDGKRLLGLVTQKTLMVEPNSLGSMNLWDIAGRLSKLTVADVMIKAKNVETADPNLTIEDAARIMVEKKVSCLPVVQDGVVIGIITDNDLLQHMVEMLATRQHCVRITMRMPDKKGELGRLVAAISAQGWGILACGGVHVPKDPSKWDAVIKIRDVPREKLVEVLSQVPGQEIVDVRES